MRTLALIILALAIGVPLARSEAVWSSYTQTNRYDFTVTEDDIAQTPVWKEQEEHPPLAARRALRLARTRLAELVTDSEQWTLEALSLEEWHNKSHWYYLAIFHPPSPPGGLEGKAIRMTIPVLMSGVAVKPKVSRWR